MKKARTLLAIWLALILTLTLFPTALADGEPTTPGDNPEEPAKIKVEWGYASNQVEIVGGQPTEISADEDFLFYFKAKEGYKITNLEILIDGKDFGNSMPGQNEEGNYPYKIVKDSLANVKKLTINIFSEELPEEQNKDSDTTPPSDPGDEGSTPSGNDPQNTEYKLTYSPGTGFESYQDQAPSEQTTANGQVTVAGFTGTVPCNIFWYWMTPEGQKINGSRRVNPGNEITLDADLTLTANWLWAIDITLNANGGTLDGGTSAQVQWYKEGNSGDFNSYTLPSKEPTRAGFVFNGWECNGQTYDAGATIPFSATSDRTMTFTAQWSKGLTVNYDIGTSYNPGGGPKSGEVVDVYEPYTIPKEEPHRYSGSYEFGSWTLDINGKTYYPGNTINWNDVGVTKDTTKVTFTAKWTPMTYPDRGDDDDDRPSRPSYSRDEYRIRVTCSDGGWVSPAGSNYVREGRNLTVTFAPYNGYAIDGVYIDGVLDNSHDGVYTFRDVDENHTIYVRYVRESSGSTGGGHYWDDDTSPKTGDTSAPLGMGLGAGSLALIAFLIARRMRRA